MSFQGGQALLINMPVSRYQYDQSVGYEAQLGIALKNKVTDRWSLTPQVAVGGEGSVDMGSISMVYSGFLKSDVVYPYNNWFFHLDNMAGYLQTQNINIDEYAMDYGLKNWAFESGGSVGYSWVHYMMDVGFSHTKIAGNVDWYYDNYNTATLSLARTKAIKGVKYRQLAVDASYVFASDNYKLVQLGLAYQF